MTEVLIIKNSSDVVGQAEVGEPGVKTPNHELVSNKGVGKALAEFTLGGGKDIETTQEDPSRTIDAVINELKKYRDTLKAAKGRGLQYMSDQERLGKLRHTVFESAAPLIREVSVGSPDSVYIMHLLSDLEDGSRGTNIDVFFLLDSFNALIFVLNDLKAKKLTHA